MGWSEKLFSSYCLRRGSVAARLLGLRVLIQPGASIPLCWSVVCCQVEVSASGWSLDKRIPTDCDVSECVRETSIMMMLWPIRGCYAIAFRCSPKHRSCHGMSRRMQALYAIVAKLWWAIETPCTRSKYNLLNGPVQQHYNPKKFFYAIQLKVILPWNKLMF